MRAVNNILLLSFLIPLFTYCQRSMTPDWHQQVIAVDIQNQLEDPNDYQGAEFKIIDQTYLESQPVVASSIAALKIYYQQIFDATGIEQKLPPLQLDTLKVYLDYLPQLADLQSKTQVNELKIALDLELQYLNQILLEFNLSIYQPLPIDSLIVYHEYIAKKSFGKFQYQSVFEIDPEKKIILAEKILHKTQIL